MLPAELFSIFYVDKDTASLVYRHLLKHSQDLKISSLGLERYRIRQNRSFRILIAVSPEIGKNLSGVLKGIKESLSTHPLYPYLCFDNYITPISMMEWNFDSYDDPNFQQIFIRKRKS